MKKFVYENEKYGTDKDIIDLKNLFFNKASNRKKWQIITADFETTTIPETENEVYIWTMTFKDKDPINHPLFPMKQVRANKNIFIRKGEEDTTQMAGINIEDFLWLITLPKARKAKVYFHNLGKFDGTYIFRHLATHNWDFRQDLRVLYEFDYLKSLSLIGKQLKEAILNEQDINTILKKSNYDYLNPENFENNSFKILVKDNQFYEFTFKDIQIWDSAKLFTMRIDDMGASLDKKYNVRKYGKDHINKEDDYTMLHKYNSLEEMINDGNKLEYALKDTFIPWKFLTDMMEDIPQNLWRMTAGSTAYNTTLDILAEQELEPMIKSGEIEAKPTKNGGVLFSRYKEKIGGKKKLRKWIIQGLLPTSWLTNEIFQDVQLWYRGGIVLVNPKYQGKFIKYVIGTDFNSDYTSIMNSKTIKAPYGDPVSESEGDWHLYKIIVKKNITNKYGLPFLTNKTGYGSSDYQKTLKAGEEYYISTPEWDRFIKYYNPSKGSYERITMYSFKTVSMKRLFGRYCDHFYKGKVEASYYGNDPLKQAMKVFLNSPYGKFGSKRKIEINWYVDGIKENHLDDYMEERFYLPLGIAITAEARMKLVDNVGFKYDIFLYCDTDSIYWVVPKFFLKKKSLLIWIKENLPIEIDKFKLGLMDLEKMWYCGLFRRAKSYALRSLTNGEYKYTIAGYHGVGKEIELTDLLTGLKTNQLRPNKKYGGVNLLEEFEKELKPIWTDKPKTDQIYWRQKDEDMVNEQILVMKQHYRMFYRKEI